MPHLSYTKAKTVLRSTSEPKSNTHTCTYTHTHPTHLTNLDLEGCLRIAEVRTEVFDGLVTSVEAITTTVTVPVCPLELFHALDGSNDVTMVTAPQHFQT